jgi:RNA polymerase sigma factor (sigma-70 family)
VDFPHTRVSVLERIRSVDAPTRERAYEGLVAAYWRPVYKYVRLRWRLTPEDAEDATQAFLAAAFEKHFFDGFDPGKARFRTFLRVCLDRFVQNQQRAERRQKRGGGQAPLPLDFQNAEGELVRHEPAVQPDLDRFFQQELTRVLFGRAVDTLRARCAERGRTLAFEAFARYDLAPAPDASYSAIGDALGIPVSQVTNHLAAMRREFRSIVLDELRELTTSDREFREEARELLGVEVEG